MIALDFPHWRFDEWRRTRGRAPNAAEERALRLDALQTAERFLAKAPPSLRDSFAFQRDLINWRHVSLREPAATVVQLAPLLEHPEVTPATRRWYAELLIDAGRPEDAMAYLRAWLAELDAAGEPDPFEGYLADLLAFLERETGSAGAAGAGSGGR